MTREPDRSPASAQTDADRVRADAVVRLLADLLARQVVRENPGSVFGENMEAPDGPDVLAETDESFAALKKKRLNA